MDSASFIATTAEVDASCSSHNNWHDSRGPEYDCSYWKNYCTAGGSYRNWQSYWGCFDDYPGTGGLTPDQACCECGGGIGREGQPASAFQTCNLRRLSEAERTQLQLNQMMVLAALVG